MSAAAAALTFDGDSGIMIMIMIKISGAFYLVPALAGLTSWEDTMQLAACSALLGAGAVLAACTTPMFTMPPGPPDYRVGFYDGCDAGYAYAGSPFYAPLQTAPEAPGVEPYRTGWLVGYNRCRTSYQHIQETVNFLLGPTL